MVETHLQGANITIAQVIVASTRNGMFANPVP